MSLRLFSRIRKQFSILSSPTHNIGFYRSSHMYDDLNWHRSRHRSQPSPHGAPPAAQKNITAPPSSSTASPTSTANSLPTSNPISINGNTPSEGSHQFNIVSFNLLAPVYKRLTSRNFTGRRDRESAKNELWQERLEQTIEFFKEEIYQDTAIIALQEYWLDARYRDTFEAQFKEYGYEYRIMQRAGTKVDAVALVIKKDVFDILGVENVDLCAMGDRVALLAWLRHKASGQDLLVATTHLSFPHHVFDRLNQVAQMKHLTSVIDWYAQSHHIHNAPVLIVGDFNVEGQSPVCDHLRSAGYYSCFEVCPPANSTVLPFDSIHPDAAQPTMEELATAASVFHGPEIGTTIQESIHTSAYSSNTYSNSSSTMTSLVHSSTYSSTTATTSSVSTSHTNHTSMHMRETISTSSTSISNGHTNGDFSLPRNTGDTIDCDDIGDACVPVDDNFVVPSIHDITNNINSNNVNTNNTNTVNTIHALLPTPRRVSYVSHFTHRAEEVGVDHIFLKPAFSTHPEGTKGANNCLPEEGKREVILPKPDGVTTQEAYSGSFKQAEVVSEYSAMVNSEGSHVTISTTDSIVECSFSVRKSEEGALHQGNDTPNNTHSSFKTSTDTSSNSNGPDNSKFSSNTSKDSGSTVSRVYVADSEVLPSSLHCTSWSKEFSISDHRPVRTRIVLI